MAAALCRKRPSPLASGQPQTWACGIIHALGQVNFLSDRSMRPHMMQPYLKMIDVCAAFGVGRSTASAKARVISNALGIHPFDPEWTLPSLIGKNPLVWMAEGDGLIVDWRTMPRKIRKTGLEKGFTPYIFASRKGGAGGRAGTWVRLSPPAWSHQPPPNRQSQYRPDARPGDHSRQHHRRRSA